MSTTVKQRANVYTTMLAISFICLVIANVFLYYEQERYQGGMKVENDLRASNARQLAEAKKNAPPEPDPMEMMPMEPDPNAPMPEPDPNAPAPDPNAPAPTQMLLHLIRMHQLLIQPQCPLIQMRHQQPRCLLNQICKVGST